MRLLTIFAFTILTLRGFAQHDSLQVGVRTPSAFYSDYNKPYLYWVEKPASFSFEVYDCWGKLLFSEDRNPDFDFTKTVENTFSENTSYIMILKFSLHDGTSCESRWQSVYHGFYCSG